MLLYIEELRSYWGMGICLPEVQSAAAEVHVDSSLVCA